MSGQTAEKIDVEAVMQRIRRDIRSAATDSRPVFSASWAKISDTTPLLFSEELNYLNANWHTLATLGDMTSHRRFIGPLIVRAKRFFLTLIWRGILRDYFERERQFQMNLVRHLNATARYIDSRIADIFWQLVHKIDADIANIHEQVVTLHDRADATLRTVEGSLTRDAAKVRHEIEVVGQGLGRLGAQLGEIEQVARGLERTVSLFAKPADGGSIPRPELGASGVDYLLLENRYRGSEEVIRERQREYVEHFRGASARVLDIGCGRGEFLELLREAGVDALGIDLDAAMIARAREKGLAVELVDLREFLRRAPDRSVGGIFAAQVVEHLTQEQLAEFIALAARKIVAGGKILLETINPNSVSALARNFFRDPTHVWPLHPETLRFQLELQGIATAELLFRSPYPPEAKLQPLPTAEYLPARWNTTLALVNQNLERLNDLLYGPQDYCLVGVVVGG